MTDTDIDELGPIDFLVVESPPGVSQFTGAMAVELAELVDAGTIRIPIPAILASLETDEEGDWHATRSRTERTARRDRRTCGPDGGGGRHHCGRGPRDRPAPGRLSGRPSGPALRSGRR